MDATVDEAGRGTDAVAFLRGGGGDLGNGGEMGVGDEDRAQFQRRWEEEMLKLWEMNGPRS
jgi:hypothetical protein